MDPAGMRLKYDLDSLSEAAAADEPLHQFDTWFEQAVAVDVVEANAMTLATVGPEGHPSTRIVLLKGYDAAGLVFFTNYESRKGRDLAAQPYAALQFFWPSLQRVVRVEGAVEQVSPAESDEYFASRPLGSRLGAWASPQSEVIADREVLVEAEAEASAHFGEHPPRPPHWGGYRLVPEVWEFWQGRPSRLHDRLRYRLDDGRWVRERLAP